MLTIPESELHEACRDAILQRRGLPTQGEAHYLAPLFTEHSDPWRRMAESVCQTAGLDVDRANRTQVLERAISTSHFSTIAAQAGNIAARIRANAALSDIRPMVSQVELSDYRPVEFPILETEELKAPGQPEGQQVELLLVTANDESLQVEHAVQNLIFSRQLLINNDFDVLLTAAEAAAAGAARQLGIKLAALLEDNDNLSDGVAWFAAGEGNLRTDGGLDLSKLDLTSNDLRQIETTGGGYSNGRPRFIVVPSTVEMTARVLASTVNESMPEEQHLRVISLPWLSSSFWYLVADPVQAPSIAMATLQGGAGDIVTFEPLPRPAYRAYSGDGTGFRIRTAVGLSAVSRNIVRNTLA